MALADQLELFNTQLKRFDHKISVVFKQHPDAEIFSSFPGAGPVVAANLLAEIGEDRNRFPPPLLSSPKPDWHRSPAPQERPHG